jgi:hypothetical protein
MRRGDVRWDGDEWRRAWQMAMRRIEGAPIAVSNDSAFRHGLDMLDGAFAKGDAFEFQLGLITLFDCCTQAISQGRCKQWW